MTQDRVIGHFPAGHEQERTGTTDSGRKGAGLISSTARCAAAIRMTTRRTRRSKPYGNKSPLTRTHVGPGRSTRGSRFAARKNGSYAMYLTMPAPLWGLPLLR